MRIGAALSTAIHAGIVAAGLWAVQGAPAPSEASTMIIIPLELVTIGDVTDIAPVTEDAKIDDEADEEEATASVAAAPPPPQEDTVALDPPEQQKKPPEEKKNEAAPAPAKSRQEEISSVLDGILADVSKDKPKKPSSEPGKAANTSKDPPRMGAGEQRKMQASVTDYIRSQLITKRCWTDHSDMADAGRLRTTIRVWFGRNNKFSKDPELVAPSRLPTNDPPMQVFVQHALTALQKCNTLGWQVPEEYFRLPQPQYIDITFLPKIGAE